MAQSVEYLTLDSAQIMVSRSRDGVPCQAWSWAWNVLKIFSLPPPTPACTHALRLSKEKNKVKSNQIIFK